MRRRLKRIVTKKDTDTKHDQKQSTQKGEKKMKKTPASGTEKDTNQKKKRAREQTNSRDAKNKDVNEMKAQNDEEGTGTKKKKRVKATTLINTPEEIMERDEDKAKKGSNKDENQAENEKDAKAKELEGKTQSLKDTVFSDAGTRPSSIDLLRNASKNYKKRRMR